MPDTVEAYIHRIGRTGRVEHTGQALTFVTPDDGAMVRAIEKRLGRRIDRVAIDGYGAGSDAVGDGRTRCPRASSRAAAGRPGPG